MRIRRLLSTAAAALTLSATGALAVDEITVAYFLEWPTPNQYAQATGAYDEALGVKVNWRAFDTGAEAAQIGSPFQSRSYGPSISLHRTASM